MQQPAATLAAWRRFAAEAPARAAELAAHPPSLSELLQQLRRRLLAERDRWPLFAPLCFGLGILLYFALPHEPKPLLLAVLALGVAGAVSAARRQTGAFTGPALIGLALALAGFATAQLRTLNVEAPVLPRGSVYTVEGTVRMAEPRSNGQRLLLEDLVVERLEQAATPERVRLTIRTVDPPILPGQRITVRARLQPPSGPLVPGGFDFARRAFFERLGGVGFAYGAPEVIGGEAAFGARPVAQLRYTVAARAEAVIGGAEGAVGGALLTGLRASIPDKVWRDMQIAGLAHLLAISGLHMTLVAGTVFLSCRFLLSLWPAFALRVVPKKPAAVVALLAALFYLILAGATVPTQRAFMMASVALLAVLLDRNPLSLRLLAYAALAVLVIAPESLLGPSFQMSFAAVTGLIAFYEYRRLTQRRAAPDDEPAAARNVLLVYFLGVLLTTLIASVATTPFAAFHFQRIATFGIVANLVAVPLTAFWIMPAGLIAMLLMPFGLDAPFLVLMGHGIRIVLEVAALMAWLPGSVIDVPPWPTTGLLAMVAGGLWLCLWRGKWRRWGFAMGVLGVIIVLLARPADLLIDRRGDFVAYRAADGTAHLLEQRRDNWLSRQMLQGAGVAEALPFETRADGQLRCDPLGCLVDMGAEAGSWLAGGPGTSLDQGRQLALALTAEAVAEDCRRAAFVVLLSGPESCANGTPSLGGRALWQSGGVAVRWRGGRVGIERVADERGQRPWTR